MSFWNRFFFFWALVISFKQLLFFPGFLVLAPVPLSIFYFVVTLATIARPTKTLGIVLMSVDSLMWLIVLPNHPNHWVLMGFVSLAALALWAWQAARERSEQWLIETLASFVRGGIIATYVISALHKINSDFLSSETTCAIRMLPEPVRHWAITSAFDELTLLAEFGIPLLLFFGRTRKAGIVLGLGMHSLFGVLEIPLTGVFEFTISAMCLYWAFFAGSAAPADPRAHGLWLDRIFPSPRPALRIVMSLLVLSAFAYAALGSGTLAPNSPRRLALLYPYLLLVAAFWIFYLRALARPSAPQRLPTEGPGRRKSAFVAAALLIAVWGITPYLGLKALPSFSMYSNLRTNVQQWNHLLLPASMKIFRFEEDLVEILEHEGPLVSLEAAAPSGQRFPRKTLECVVLPLHSRLLTPAARHTVRALRLSSGETFDLSLTPGAVHSNAQPVECALWERKLLSFRSYLEEAHETCRW